jgi:hypothetical protein
MLKILGTGAALGLMLASSVQQPVQVQIVSPAEGAYVSDRLLLEARIVPIERRAEVTEVTFFADGRVVCRTRNIQRPTCEWDAGPVIKPHLIRVVADTTAGERVIATTRTREVDFKESVKIQVVQARPGARTIPGARGRQTSDDFAPGQ